MRVVICGGGVIAASTAWFLTRRGIEVIVVERNEVACAASGKAGGFLALDWCAGTPLDRLARRSFALHERLAGEIAGDWGYRRMTAYGGYVLPDRDPGRREPAPLGWLSEGIAITSRLGTPETTAIAHPAKFTKAVMQAAQAQGAEIRHARVVGLTRGMRGVETDGGLIEADAVVIAMGPWSILAAQWLPLPAIGGVASPSLVFDTGNGIPAEALFLEHQDEAGAAVTVEVFPRADGSTLLTAYSGSPDLPVDPADVAPDPAAIERLEALGERLSPALRRDRIIARQACFRPFTRDYLPLIGEVPGVEGAYVATGHNVWGILNAPATGEAMAELIADGAACNVDLAPFDPGRLRPLDPARRRGATALR